jgi:hypothetical protein
LDRRHLKEAAELSFSESSRKKERLGKGLLEPLGPLFPLPFSDAEGFIEWVVVYNGLEVWTPSYRRDFKARPMYLSWLP